METLQNAGCLLDQNCTLTIKGKSFTSGGAFIGIDKNGKKGGTMYAYPKTNEVGNWDGTIKIKAYYGTEYRSNFGDVRQSVYFTYEGTRFYGVYYKQNSDIIRCREIKPD